MTLIFNKVAILDAIHWFILAQKKDSDVYLYIRDTARLTGLDKQIECELPKSHDMPLPFFGTFTIK